MSEAISPKEKIKQHYDEGQLILIDKDLSWTSFDVVKKVRNLTKAKKVGHAGTLDPLATGLLILCTGKKTKEIDQYQAQEKEYTGIFRLGETTPSYDGETAVDQRKDISKLGHEDIHQACQPFLGRIEQSPPIYSAIKMQGERLYEKARKGESVEIKTRPVEIHQFLIEKIDLPEVHFRVICSKGTYIRSLARDFGEALSVGAYLSALRRERIGSFGLDNSLKISEFEALIKEQLG